MPYNPPTDELVKFLETGVKDPLPTTYDAGNSAVAEKYTKVWAEYHNKLRNFIGIVEPLCSTSSAENQGLLSLTYWTLNPAPLLLDIFYGSAKKAIVLGKTPPTNIFPFEIVITSSTDDYTAWHKQTGLTSPPMLYQASQANINKIVLGNMATIRPMVQCCIKSTSSNMFSTRWTVNSYCVNGADTLLIRGSIIDNLGAHSPMSTTSLPSLSQSFPGADAQVMNVTLVGAR